MPNMTPIPYPAITWLDVWYFRKYLRDCGVFERQCMLQSVSVREVVSTHRENATVTDQIMIKAYMDARWTRSSHCRPCP